MNNIDWNIIFKLNEYIEFVRTNDLIQLSMCSKNLRNILSKDALNNLNLPSFTSSGDYSSLFIKEGTCKCSSKFNIFINPYEPLNRELIESKKEFSNDLKLLKVSPKKLVVNDYGMYHYLLNEIPSIFPNITTLVLNGSDFTMDAFQYLLDNFKCLENLELTDNLIFHNAEISIDYTITYPTSLKSLKLRNNGFVMVQDKINPITSSHYDITPGTHNCYQADQHLPNLVNFDYDTECGWPGGDEDHFKFIKLNPQLKRLKLSGDIKIEIFDIIKDYENLTHFKFNCDYYLEDLEDYEMPMLYNIKHLHLDDDLEYINEIFIDNFPNVTELLLGFFRNISNEINHLIESFSNLKSLKFILNDNSKYVGKLTVPKLNSLEKIEFNLNYEEGGFEDVQWDMSACDKLKLITYTKNEIYSPFEMPKLTEELAKHWNLNYLSHKLTFIKY